MTLRIKQYVYFAVYSSVMSAAEVTEVVGLEPDQTMTRGSRRSGESPAPGVHAWEIVCNEAGLAVDEQVEEVIARLRPHQSALRDVRDRLHDDPKARFSLTMIRHFDDPEGEAGDYQHHLLGWALTKDILQFLVEVGADLDADEYGQD